MLSKQDCWVTETARQRYRYIPLIQQSISTSSYGEKEVYVHENSQNFVNGTMYKKKRRWK